MTYQFYTHFPKHPHFYYLKTYQRTQWAKRSRLIFLIFLALLGLSSTWQGIAFGGELLWQVFPFLFLLSLVSSLDFALHLIPFRLLLGLLMWELGYDVLLPSTIEAIVLGGCFVFLYLLSLGKVPLIGKADIYLLAVLAFFFPLMLWLELLLLACVFGLAYAIYQGVRATQYLPFAPWICAAACLLFPFRVIA